MRDDLFSFCQPICTPQLGLAHPRFVEFIAAVPLAATNKPDRRRLTAEAERIATEHVYERAGVRAHGGASAVCQPCVSVPVARGCRRRLRPMVWPRCTF